MFITCGSYRVKENKRLNVDSIILFSLFVELRFLTFKRVEYILKILNFKSEGTVNLIKLFF